MVHLQCRETDVLDDVTLEGIEPTVYIDNIRVLFRSLGRRLYSSIWLLVGPGYPAGSVLPGYVRHADNTCFGDLREGRAVSP